MEEGALRGRYLLRRPRQTHGAFELAYQQALLALTTDQRPKGATIAVSVFEEFAGLPDTAEAAIQFTQRFGPLLWGPERYRFVSRPPRPRERLRGRVTGKHGRVVDQIEWSLPLVIFRREQRKYRVLARLALAASTTDPREEVVALLREGVELFSAFRELGELTEDALDRMEREARHPEGEEAEHEVEDSETRAIGRALAWIEDKRQSDTGQRDLKIRAGEIVADLVNRLCPQSRVVFDPREGFSLRTPCSSLADALYSLLVRALPQSALCANCARIYWKTRPDKNTCSARCAGLLGKRKWARKDRAEERNRKRAAAANPAASSTVDRRADRQVKDRARPASLRARHTPETTPARR